MMIRFANGDTACIDYRETAPAAAGRDVYLDADGQIVPKASTLGLSSRAAFRGRRRVSALRRGNTAVCR
jgi:gamma-glutamyltranspeptidase